MNVTDAATLALFARLVKASAQTLNSITASFEPGDASASLSAAFYPVQATLKTLVLLQPAWMEADYDAYAAAAATVTRLRSLTVPFGFIERRAFAQSGRGAVLAELRHLEEVTLGPYSDAVGSVDLLEFVRTVRVARVRVPERWWRARRMDGDLVSDWEEGGDGRSVCEACEEEMCARGIVFELYED